MITDRRSRDALLAVSLFSLGVLTRLPFRSQILYHWDSVNFALGMEHFDVHLHQPHPPGYFLYVMLGRLVNLLIGDGNASLVWVSIVATGLAAVVIFFLGQSLWDRRSGIVAALLLLSSPLFWFHGEVALSYMIEAVFVTLVVLLCFHHLTEKEDRLWLSALALGIAGGFRQNTMVFLLPLWVVVAWRFRWRRLVLALIVLALTCAAWLLPMVALTGGAERYWEAVGAASRDIAEESSLFDVRQMVINGARLTVFTAYALCIGLLPLALGTWYWGKRCLREWRSWVQRPRTQLFFCWISPSLIFYFFIHIRQQGHSFTFMPAVLLLTAAAIGQVADWVGERWRRAVYAGLTIGVVSVNILFFLTAPSALLGSPHLLLSAPSWRSIQAQDLYVGERVRAIRVHFPPQSTAVLATGRSFRYPDYYLRDYRYTSLSYSLGKEHKVLENVDTLVLFDAELLDRVYEPSLVHSLALPDGDTLSYLNCGDGEALIVSSERIACQWQE
jgi:4-amino-4-deoxy-L-arabinose transferase-like glycosyltransferase